MSERCQHTFIVLSYKKSPYLEQCIISLLRQTIPSKIIVCTSTPNDYVKRIVNQYRLPLIINKEQKGIASDWNFALQQAKTQFVTLAHQDDIYLQDYTKYLLPLMKSDKKSLIGFSDYRETINKQGKIFVRKLNFNLLIKHILIFFAFFPFKKTIDKKWQKKKLIRFGSPIPCPSVMYNMNNLKNFSFNKSYSINMDWYAWYQMSKRDGSIVLCSKSLLNHRIHQGSATSDGIANKSRLKEDIQMFNLLWPKRFAKILNFFYKLSYRNNEI